MNNFTNTRVVTVKNKKKKGNKEKLCVESITVIKVQSSISKTETSNSVEQTFLWQSLSRQCRISSGK